MTPFDFKTTSVGATSVGLRWNESAKTVILASISRYRVQRSTDRTNWTTVSDTINALAYTVSGLTSCTTYYFRVSAYGDGRQAAARWSSPSSYLRVNTLCPPDPVTPADFKTTSVGATSVSLRWNENARSDILASISRYRVQWSTDGTNWTTVSSNIGNTNYKVTGLTSCTTYQFRVSAYGDGSNAAAKWSPHSNSISAKTTGCITDLVLPDPVTPADLRAASVGQTSFVLWWNEHFKTLILDSISRYRVQRSEDNANWATLSSNVGGNNYGVSGLTPCTTYYFRVSAHGDGSDAASKWSPHSASLRVKTSCLPEARFGASLYTVGEGASTTIEVLLSRASGQSLTIPINVRNGSAEGGDYSVSGLPLAFGPNDTRKTFTVTANQDRDCSDETVMFDFGTLPAGVVPGSPSSATLTIDDDDSACLPEVSISASTSSVTEGQDVTFTLAADPAPPSDLRVSLSISETGAFLRDSPPSWVTIPEDSSSAQLTLPTEDDSVDETDGSVTATLSAGTGYGVGSPSSTTVDILDNDDDNGGVAPAPGPGPGMPPNVSYTLTRTKGAIELDWDAAARADGYEVRYCQARRPDRPEDCTYITRQILDKSKTSTTFTGLVARDAAHKFVIRAKKGARHADSDEISVSLRPAPQNLRGLYVAGQYRQITLTWDPVPNPDVADDLDGNYHVEQRFPNRNPLDSGWKRLPHAGVTIGPIINDGGRLQVVVSGLVPGEAYEYRIKAQSVQGKSVESNVVTTTVTDEAPMTAPPTPIVSSLIGYRGFQLEWMPNVSDATSYLVRATPDSPSLEFVSDPLTTDTVTEIPNSPWVEVSPGSGLLNVLGLVPGTNYTFSVKGHNGSGSGPASTSVTHGAIEPTHWWGHQADHTVGYVMAVPTFTATSPATSTNKVLHAAIPTAVAKWNASSTTYGLMICDTAESACHSRNSDKFIVTIKTVAVASPSDNSTGCGSSNACVSPTERGRSAPDGIGDHMTNMDVIFEDPGYGCYSDKDPCPSNEQVWYEWTSNPNMSGVTKRPAPQPGMAGPPPIVYAYAEHLALHELGHTLGLPDFYSLPGVAPAHHHSTNYDPRLNAELAIMKFHWDAKSIQNTDIAQLDAIYRRHSSHDAK